MSVIFFGASELAQIVKVCISRVGHLDRERTLNDLCDSLATISKANAACFVYRYQGRHGGATPVTAEEIKALASKWGMGLTTDEVSGAMSTARLLGYNCVEDRNFFDDVEGGHAAHAYVLGSMFKCVADRLEAQNERIEGLQHSVTEAHAAVREARQLHSKVRR